MFKLWIIPYLTKCFLFPSQCPGSKSHDINLNWGSSLGACIWDGAEFPGVMISHTFSTIDPSINTNFQVFFLSGDDFFANSSRWARKLGTFWCDYGVHSVAWVIVFHFCSEFHPPFYDLTLARCITFRTRLFSWRGIARSWKLVTFFFNLSFLDLWHLNHQILAPFGVDEASQ